MKKHCNYVAAEYWQSNFDAISTATANGIILSKQQVMAQQISMILAMMDFLTVMLEIPAQSL